MYIHRSGLIYLAHPKTASTSTMRVLLNAGFVKPNRHDRHSTLYKDGTITPDNREKFYVFTTVRNHFDAAVSWAFMKKRGGGWNLDLFKRALDPGSNPYIKEHSLWWMHSDDADRILKFESLQEDLDKLFTEYQIPVAKLPMENVTNARGSRAYREFYNDTTRAYVEERFKDELEKFEYTF